MTPDELEQALAELGLTNAQFAEALGLSRPGTISDWKNNDKIPNYVPLALDGIRYRQQQQKEYVMELTAQDIYGSLIGKEIESKAARELLSDDCDLEHEVKYCLDQAWRIKEDEAEQDAIIATKDDPEKLAAFTQEVRELAEAAVGSEEE